MIKKEFFFLNKHSKIFKTPLKFGIGYTLTEMIFVVLLIGILMTAVYPYLRAAHNGWKTTDRRSEVIQNGRVGMDKMVKILRECTGFTSVTTSSDSNGRIVFLNKDSNAEEFKKYNDGTIDCLGYVTGGSTYSLAGPITSLKFTCYEQDATTTTTTPANIKLVDIELIVSDEEGEVSSQTLTSKVAYRND